MFKPDDPALIGQVVSARISYCHGCQSCLRLGENDKITQTPHIIFYQLEDIICKTGSAEDHEYYKRLKELESKENK